MGMARRKKVRGKRDPGRYHDLGELRPPFPGHAVVLPLSDPVHLLRAAGLAPQEGCDDRLAAQLLNEVRVALHELIVGNHFRLGKGISSEQLSDDTAPNFPQNSAMSARARDPAAIAAGARLKATRVALGVTKVRRFAQLLDVSEHNLTKWENGASMVPPAFVAKLKQVYGVTFDWIFAGDLARMPHDLALKLMDHENG